MNLWKQILIIILPYFIDCTPEFTETENEIIYSLSEYFHVGFCVYGVTDRKSDVVSVSINSSYPAKLNLYTAVMTFSEITAFLNDENGMLKYGQLTMVVFKMNEATMSALKELSNKMSISPLIWIMFAEDTFDSRLKIFEGLYIPFDCEFLYINPKGTSWYFMTEIYRIERTSGVESNRFGSWSKRNGEDATNYPNHKLQFYNRRNSLKGHVFKAVIEDNAPYTKVVQKRKSDGSTTYEYGGYLYEVWKELEFRIKFTTEFPEKYINSKPVEALVGNKELHFAVAPITIDPKTSRQIDLSQPTYDAKIYLFGNRPGSELEWDSYLKPFSRNTWLVNLGWMICSSIALAILYRIAWTCGTSEKEADYFVFTVSESFATVFRAMCMQGSDVTPRSNSCRLLFLSIYLTALVVTSAFSAALFSLLTIPISKAPFNSFEEVLNTRGYRMGILQNSDIHKGLIDLAERFPNSVHNKLLTKLLQPPEKLPSSLMEGLQRVCDDKMYIFMWDLPNVLDTLQNMTRYCQEKIMDAGPMVFKEQISFGMSKGNPYRGLINLHLVNMRNEGIMKRLLLNYWPPRLPTVTSTWVRVTLADISPILYMFGLGALLGVVFLILENGKAYISKRDISKRDDPNHSMNNKYFWNNLSHFIPGHFKTKWDDQNGEYTQWGGNNDNKWQNNNHHGFWERNYSNDPYKDAWTK